jgi:hypothetical protein
MTQKLLQQVVQSRTEQPVTAEYRAWKAAMAAPGSEQSCKPSGGPAARAGRFCGMTGDGYAEFVMPEGY